MRECGIFNVEYQHQNPEDDYVALTATFGDGKMRVLTNVWSDDVGITITYDPEHAIPWAKEDYINGSDKPPSLKDKPVIALNFDKVESIDGVITQLNYIRDILVSQKGG